MLRSSSLLFAIVALASSPVWALDVGLTGDVNAAGKRVGDVVKFTIQVNSDDTATSDLVITLDLPTGLTYLPPRPLPANETFDSAEEEVRWVLNEVPDEGVALVASARIDAAKTFVSEVKATVEGDTNPANNRVWLVVAPVCDQCSGEEVKPPADCVDVPCCQAGDAHIKYRVKIPQSKEGNYTAQGVNAFITIFSAAAARGMENAAVRAFNGTSVCTDCKDCPEFPCGWTIVTVGGRRLAKAPAGPLAFDVATLKQANPNTGNAVTQPNFLLESHPLTKKWYLVDLDYPADAPVPKSKKYDLETGFQIDPDSGRAFSPNEASHRLIFRADGRWFRQRLGGQNTESPPEA